MQPNEALKFAVVREDYRVESYLVGRTAAQQALVVASGGCTALSLLARHPGLEVTAFDINPRQLEHVQAKAKVARSDDAHARLNIRDDDAEGLNQCGAFEGLFQLLRRYMETFVMGSDSWRTFFRDDTDSVSRRALVDAARRSRYWSAGFVTVLNDALLHAMFGPDATQHALPGSYPAYFEKVLTDGLLRDDAHANPFLQHIFLGRYKKSAAPLYVRNPSTVSPYLIHGPLSSVADLDRFDVISMSNLFDWADDAFAAMTAKMLVAKMRPGAWLVIRQLNNTRDLPRFFAPHVAFDQALGARLHGDDQSLFYNRVLVGRRVASP